MSTWSKQNKNSASWTKETSKRQPKMGRFGIGQFDKAKFNVETGTFWKKQSKN